jgi:uncharacterized protein (TIGR03086 family)
MNSLQSIRLTGKTEHAARGALAMTLIDLEPAAERMAGLIRGVPEDQLDGPTPCPDYCVGDLVDHVGGLALAFTAAATKDTGGDGSQGPSGDAARLGEDWRARIPLALAGLAQAWRQPAAWSGMTQAGGVDLPGEIAGLVALDELVLHGWDVAQATGQAYECEPAILEAVYQFVAPLAVPGQEAQREGLFGPVVEVPGAAPLLDRVIGLSGRDPAWQPSS